MTHTNITEYSYSIPLEFKVIGYNMDTKYFKIKIIDKMKVLKTEYEIPFWHLIDIADNGKFIKSIEKYRVDMKTGLYFDYKLETLLEYAFEQDVSESFLRRRLNYYQELSTIIDIPFLKIEDIPMIVLSQESTFDVETGKEINYALPANVCPVNMNSPYYDTISAETKENIKFGFINDDYLNIENADVLRIEASKLLTHSNKKIDMQLKVFSIISNVPFVDYLVEDLKGHIFKLPYQSIFY